MESSVECGYKQRWWKARERRKPGRYNGGPAENAKEIAISAHL